MGKGKLLLLVNTAVICQSQSAASHCPPNWVGNTEIDLQTIFLEKLWTNWSWKWRRIFFRCCQFHLIGRFPTAETYSYQPLTSHWCFFVILSLRNCSCYQLAFKCQYWQRSTYSVHKKRGTRTWRRSNSKGWWIHGQRWRWRRPFSYPCSSWGFKYGSCSGNTLYDDHPRDIIRNVILLEFQSLFDSTQGNTWAREGTKLKEKEGLDWT